MLEFKSRQKTRCYTVAHFGGQNSSVGRVLGLLSCSMQSCGFNPAWDHPIEGILPFELTSVLAPFSKTHLDEGINRGLVSAHMHSILWTQKMLTFMS